MNRRQFTLLQGTLIFPLISSAKNKKKKDKKKRGAVVKEVSGTVVLVKEKITVIYKILAKDRAYTFGRSVHGKVKDFVDQEVTVTGRVLDEIIAQIISINSK